MTSKAYVLNSKDLIDWVRAHKDELIAAQKSGAMRKPCPTCGRAFT